MREDSSGPKVAAFGLRVQMRALRPIAPLGHHGSWLRGVLGHALFRGVCLFDQPQCERCAQRGTCPYPQVFKPSSLPGRDRLPGYVLHDWQMPAGRRDYSFTLVLIGSAARHAATWLRHLVDQAPRLTMNGAGAGDVLQIQDLASGTPLLQSGRFVPGTGLHPLIPPPVAAGPVSVRLLTPLVTKHSGPDPLLGPLRTRLQRLANDYGDGARLVTSETPPWRVTGMDLRTAVVPRGTDTPRRVGGQKGSLLLDEVNDEGRHLLALGYYLHAGAETSLGFGRYQYGAPS